jgi:hypothetical protein
MKPGRPLLAVLLVAVILGAGGYVIRARSGSSRVLPGLLSADGAPRAPSNVRVRVAVVNTTRVRGLARRATRLLRDRGFDVVEMGTAGPIRDSTLVLDRSGHPAWASAVAKIVGGGARTEARPDSSRYLDITVLLGRDFRAPSEPLDP